MGKKILAASFLWLISIPLVYGIPQTSPESLSLEEKILGFITVYAEVKYNFIFADRLNDWAEKASLIVPQILSAPDVASYYNLLKRWVGTLGNGHTLVHAPNTYWDSFNMPPVECVVIGDRVYISRVGRREDIVRQGLRPGLEILEVEGEPALKYFENSILPLCSFSRKETAFRRYSMWLLAGPREKPARFRVTGNREIVLRRDTKEDTGGYFIRKQDDPLRHNLENRLINGILYVNLASFGVDPAVLSGQFDEILKKNVLDKLHGIVLDLRDNGGGNDEAAFGIAQRFISKPVSGAKSRIRKYSGARKAWGNGDEWEDLEPSEILPAREGTPHFHGPLVLLTGPETASAAEDFAMVLQKSGRAVFVGERTAGDTGQIISFGLPQGGVLWVCTKWDFQPDGSGLIGIGLPPDYEVPLSWNDLVSGKDRILEHAISVIEGRIVSGQEIYDNHRVRCLPELGNTDTFSIPFSPEGHHIIRRVLR